MGGGPCRAAGGARPGAAAGPPRTVLGALFDPLDPETEKRFGIGEEARRDEPELEEAAKAQPAKPAAEARDQPAPTEQARGKVPEEGSAEVARKAPEVGLRDFSRQDFLTVGKSTFTQIGEDRVTYVAGGVTFFGLIGKAMLA